VVNLDRDIALPGGDLGPGPVVGQVYIKLMEIESRLLLRPA